MGVSSVYSRALIVVIIMLIQQLLVFAVETAKPVRREIVEANYEYEMPGPPQALSADYQGVLDAIVRGDSAEVKALVSSATPLLDASRLFNRFFIYEAAVENHFAIFAYLVDMASREGPLLYDSLSLLAATGRGGLDRYFAYALDRMAPDAQILERSHALKHPLILQNFASVFDLYPRKDGLRLLQMLLARGLSPSQYRGPNESFSPLVRMAAGGNIEGYLLLEAYGANVRDADAKERVLRTAGSRGKERLFLYVYGKGYGASVSRETWKELRSAANSEDRRAIALAAEMEVRFSRAKGR